jgi:Tol biopolymer transport system component/DNA-binding winged helix-turn-helix (wHTH) protein
LIQNAPQPFQFGRYRLDRRTRVLLLDEQLVALPAKTLDLLILLVDRPGEIVSRDEILTAIWPDSVVEDSNVTVHVSLLRKTLARGMPGVNVIETAPKKGYRFAAPPAAVEPGGAAEDLRGPAVPEAALQPRYAWLRATAICAGIGLLILLTSSHRAPQGDPDFRILPITASGNAGYADISPDGRQLAWLDNSASEQTFWVSDVDPLTPRMLLPPGRNGHCPPIFTADGLSVLTCHTADGAKKPDIVRIPLRGGERQVLVTGALGPQGVSPNGRKFSFITYEDQAMSLWVADLDGRNRRLVKTVKHPVRFGSTAWSPDSSTIAYWYSGAFASRREGRIGAVRVADSSEIAVGNLHWSAQSAGLFIKWLAGGKALVVTGMDPDTGHWQVYELGFPSMSVRRVTHDLADYADLSVSADNGRLVTTRTESSSHLWLAPGGDVSRAVQLTHGSTAHDEPAWTANGRIVYASRGVWQLDPTTGHQARIPGTLPDDHSPQISSDGSTLIFVSERSGTPEIWKMPVSGGPAVRLTHEENCGDPRFSPDGRAVVYDSYVKSELTVNRTDLSGGAPVRLSPINRIWHPVYSPDGKWLAVYWRPFRLDESAKIQILPAAGGVPAASLEVGRYTGFQLEWTPDSRLITWVKESDGVDDIWGLEAAGGSPRQLTKFHEGMIAGFGWSARGDLVVARGAKRRDVVMFEHYLSR